jgi:hypothetical protein
MSPRPGRSLLGLALLRSVQLGLLLAGLGWIATSVEAGGSAAELGPLFVLLGPVAVASGTAMAIAQVRGDGSWSAWEGLGYRPRRQLSGLVAIAGIGLFAQATLVGGGSLLGGVDTPSEVLQLPPPVSPWATSWPNVDMTEPEGMAELAFWQRPPAQLSWFDLQRRRNSEGLLGARGGVDSAESLRRAGGLVAWPLGLLWAVLIGLRTSVSAREESGLSPLGSAVFAGLGSVGWCLLVLVCSAAAAGS